MRRLALPAAALLAWTAGAAASAVSWRGVFPPPAEIHTPAAGASADMLALALGARRLFADVWFIRLLQYYGTSEIQDEDEGGFEWLKPAAGDGHHHHDETELNGGGRYPEFLRRSLHVLEIDPYFTASALYGAGSLAFNLLRPDEAVELLNYALRYSPREWKYAKVLAAIGYSRGGGDPAAVAAEIMPLLKDPDCPVMLKQQAAFLNKRLGNYAAAAAIYADIAATSRDTAYVRNAERQLELLARTLAPAAGRGKASR
jgi:tetratricopeptide (TPR) repeat protein